MNHTVFLCKRNVWMLAQNGGATEVWVETIFLHLNLTSGEPALFLVSLEESIQKDGPFPRFHLYLTSNSQSLSNLVHIYSLTNCISTVITFIALNLISSLVVPIALLTMDKVHPDHFWLLIIIIIIFLPQCLVSTRYSGNSVLNIS